MAYYNRAAEPLIGDKIIDMPYIEIIYCNLTYKLHNISDYYFTTLKTLDHIKRHICAGLLGDSRYLICSAQYYC